jgi:hypothetical protein
MKPRVRVALLLLAILTLFSSVAVARPSLHVSANESCAAAGRTSLVETGWSPTWIVGVKAWWRSDLGITLNSTTVSAWADQIQGLSASQGTGSAQPTYNASDAAYGGHPSLSYLGTSHQQLNVGVGLTVAQPLSDFLVGQSNLTTNSAWTDFSSSRVAITTFATGYDVYAGVGYTFAHTLNQATALATVINGASSSTYVGSSTTVAGSGNAGTNGFAGTSLGGASVNTTNLTGKLVEMIITNSAADVFTRGRVMTYESNLFGGAWQ